MIYKLINFNYSNSQPHLSRIAYIIDSDGVRYYNCLEFDTNGDTSFKKFSINGIYNVREIAYETICLNKVVNDDIVNQILKSLKEDGKFCCYDEKKNVVIYFKNSFFSNVIVSKSGFSIGKNGKIVTFSINAVSNKMSYISLYNNKGGDVVSAEHFYNLIKQVME